MAEVKDELEERLKVYDKDKLEGISKHLKSRGLNKTVPYLEFNDLYRRLTNRIYE